MRSHTFKTFALVSLWLTALSLAACEDLNPQPSGLLGFRLNGVRWEAETVDVRLSRSPFGGGGSKTLTFAASSLDGSSFELIVTDVQGGSEGACLAEDDYFEPGDPQNAREGNQQSSCRIRFTGAQGEAFDWTTGLNLETELSDCSGGSQRVSGSFSGTLQSVSSPTTVQITDGDFNDLNFTVVN